MCYCLDKLEGGEVGRKEVAVVFEDDQDVGVPGQFFTHNNSRTPDFSQLILA